VTSKAIKLFVKSANVILILCYNRATIIKLFRYFGFYLRGLSCRYWSQYIWYIYDE